jgi:hypothetical protein
MITCQTATERLVAHWSASTPRHTEELQAAIDHVHHCSRCEGRLGFLIRALSTDEEDPLTCTECEALLPDYVQAEQNGSGNEARWQPVAVHLASCPACTVARAELVSLLDLTFGEASQPPAPTPAPDLAFLRPALKEPADLDEPAAQSKPAAPPWRLDDLGRMIVELTDELLGALLPPARQPACALAGLKSAAPGTLFRLPIQAPDAGLNVTIQAETARAAPDRCTLTVSVDIPSRGGWPHLAGTEVTLCQAGREPDQEWTDAYGEALFENVPVAKLSGLVIEVLPDG